MRNTRNNLPVLILMILILSGVFHACLNKNADEKVETYKLTEEKIKYKGYLSPANTKILPVNEGDLKVKDGDFVEKGEQLLFITDKKQAEIDAINGQLKKEKDRVVKIQQNIKELNKGNYNVDSGLVSIVDTIQEAIDNHELSIELLKIDMEEAEFNFQLENEKNRKEIVSNQSEIEKISKKIEDLKKSDEVEDVVAESINDLQGQLSLLKKENEELQVIIQSSEHSYDLNIKRLKQNEQTEKELLSKTNGQLTSITSGKKNSPELKASLEQFQEQLDVAQNTVSELSLTLQNTIDESELHAAFDGQIIIEQDIVSLHSKIYQLIFHATEQQVNEVKQIQSPIIEYKNKEIGELEFKKFSLNDELSIPGQAPIYNMIFDLPASINNKQIRGATAYIVHNKGLIIPKQFLNKDDNEYYVIIDGEKRMVEIEENDEQYFIVKGAKVGELLEKENQN